MNDISKMNEPGVSDLTIDDIIEEGEYYSFYGVYNNMFKLGSLTFEAVEDPDDGYRSYLDCVPLVKTDAIFSRLPIINLKYTVDGNFIHFTDDTGHVWLKIGTDHSEDWYPVFIFYYNPRTDVKEFSEETGNLDNILDPYEMHVEKMI